VPGQGDAAAEQQPADDVGGVERCLGMQRHQPEALQGGDHHRAGGNRCQEHLQHDEVAELHLPDDHAGLEDPRLFQGEAEHGSHGQTDQYCRDD